MIILMKSLTDVNLKFVVQITILVGKEKNKFLRVDISFQQCEASPTFKME